MAVVGRYSLSVLTADIREAWGQTTAGRSKLTDANLYPYINRYVQEFRQRVQTLEPNGRIVIFPKYFEREQTISTSSGSSQAWLPENCDIPILAWDNTHDREVRIVNSPHRIHSRLQRQSEAGPPRALQILGFASNSGTWQKEVRIIPDTVSGVTPVLRLDQYRVPASMNEAAPTTEYSDIDPRYQSAIVWGVVAELMMPTHPAYSRVREEEQKALRAALAEAEYL